MTEHKIDLSMLKAPFYPDDIEWRIQQSGRNNRGPWAKVLAYIQARAIHDRLDAVCGPQNWQLRYLPHHDGTVCEIGIQIDGEWIWKAGGAGDTAIESFKGGLSGSEKRAGVPWGIGRYLYKLQAGWATITPDGRYSDKIGDQYENWNPPPLPAWALPDGVTQEEPPLPPKQHRDHPTAKNDPTLWCADHKCFWERRSNDSGEVWYSHKITNENGVPTGQWCNKKDDPAPDKLPEDAPLIRGLPYPENLGQLFEYCQTYFGMKPSEVVKEQGHKWDERNQIDPVQAWDAIKEVKL